MSAKWIRSKQWDDEHIPGSMWPVKVVLRAFSSIPLAIVLLSLVVVYAILASVPVGLLVLGLTDLVYGMTLLLVVGAAGVLPVLVMRRLWRPRGQGERGVRFAMTVLTGVTLSVAGAQLWFTYLWPTLQYDPAHGTGLRLFADFVAKYRTTTLRRLPGLEMSELEFYSWWPLRVVLLLFVLNMVTATVRRIEFTFPNLGVLTVHTGIVVIALGSMYYKGLKQEGDTLLLAGEPGPDGAMTVGRPQDGFYDNTRVVLWAKLADRWEQRPIRAPRYNDYNLSAGGGPSAVDAIGRGNPPGADGGRTLDRPIEPVLRPGAKSLIDPDISLRMVGYASYAEPRMVWTKAEGPAEGSAPVRFADLVVSGQAGGGERSAPFYFVPDSPAERLGETEVFGLEYTRGMSPQRAADLAEELPAGARHALVVEVPAAGGRPAFRGVFAAEIGKEIAVGDTGYRISVKELAEQPPFPIITEGYRDATSSVAIVRITPPAGETGAAPGAYDRWVYHRFPEISQDLLDELNERGMPRRRDADPAIRVSYIDASKLQVYLDEQADGTVRAIIRRPGKPARVVDGLQPHSTIPDLIPPSDGRPGLHLRLGDRWEHAVRAERPVVTPVEKRENEDIGTHNKAMLAVEVSVGDSWKEVVWLPFTKYLAADLGTERTIEIPGGRRLSLAFGRLRYTLPGFFIQLADFQMVAYDHRGSPRDYQSLIRVVPDHRGGGEPAFRAYQHITKLNAPLQAPFMWSEERSYLGNVAGTLVSRLSPRQFKFSQAGWDARTWQMTQQLADEGKVPRPYVTFTILGVGNNPGIHIVALGAILMSVGIPWAFYIKPLIMRRRKAALKAQVAAGTFRRSAPAVGDPVLGGRP